MTILSKIIIVLLIGLIIFAIVYFIKSKNKNSIQFILLGIEITLIGGIMILDNTNYYGLEYLIILIGLVFSIIGFVKNT